MTPVLVVCCLDGTPFVYPDGSIRVVVPGADVDLSEHGGQCEVRPMALISPPARAELPTLDLDELEPAPKGGHVLRRDSASEIALVREATPRRTWYAVHGGRRYRVATRDGYVVEADGEIVHQLLGLCDADARKALREAGAKIEDA